MQPDREHLRRQLALRVQGVERVAQVGEELLAGVEALRCGEAHVVGVEVYGTISWGLPRDLLPVRQVVGVGVGIVEESPCSATRRRVLSLVRPVYQPRGREPVTSSIVLTARAMWSRSSASGMPW
jgi:hypothetical protein